MRGVTFPSGEAAPTPFDESIACLTTAAVQDAMNWTSRRYIPRRRVQNDQLLREGDLLVSTANSKELVGKSCLIQDLPEPATFGAFVTVIRCTAQADSYFLAFLFRRPETLAYCYTTSSNTTGISNLRVNDLFSLTVPLPPLPEQRRIAAILTEQMKTVERARDATEAQLYAIQKLPAALLRRAFNGTL